MTDETKFRLLAAFRCMQRQIDMSNFNSRLVFQKLTYLLQELGLQLNNGFGWYIKGPYSSDAASDGFQLAPIQDRVEHIPELSEDELRSLETFGRLLAESREEFADRDEAYSLELLASLHFLLKYGYPRPRNRDEALERFLELKPRFGDDARTALELLERHGLVPL